MGKLLLYLLFLPLFSFAQEGDELVPLPEADLIIVETSGNLEERLKELAFLMQDKGFFIQDYNKELQNIIASRRINSSDMEVKVNAYIRQSEKGLLHLYFFGEYNSINGKDQYQGRAIYNKSLLRREERIAFEEINKLTKAFPGGSVRYSKL